MRKNTKKRGRPAIKPGVLSIIMTRVRDEQREPPEKRMPPKVLAHAIQREIIEKAKGEKPPKLSTLEKKILEYRKEPSPKDEPWDIFSLLKYPIPPEALPTVLRMWSWTQEELDMNLTIREAQWVARLYTAVNAVAKDSRLEERQMAFLSVVIRAYAATEMVAELTGSPLNVGASFDLMIWWLITGQQITPKLGKNWLSEKKEGEIYWKFTKKEWDLLQQMNEQLKLSLSFEVYEHKTSSTKKKEAQNDG